MEKNQNQHNGINRLLSSVLLLSSTLLLSSCTDWRTYNRPQNEGQNQTLQDKYATNSPGSYRGSYYQVKKGDTLYFISYLTGSDVNDLIYYNNLHEPYSLYVGQKISLVSVGSTSGTALFEPAVSASPQPAQVLTATPSLAVGDSSPKILSTTRTDPYSDLIESNEKEAQLAMQNSTRNAKSSAVELQKEQINNINSIKKSSTESLVQTKIPATKTSEKSVKYNPVLEEKLKKSGTVSPWIWPAKGNVITRFSSGDLGNKGVDIGGSTGQSILASADGKVVHSGNALRGYGNLIIIKHNQDYLSAYAHNETLLVKEGDYVKVGQKIATMGNTGTNRVQLHFEIRYKGKSVNPERYLP